MKLSDIIRFPPGVPRVSAYPKTVIIETTNACNLRCKMCHVWGEGVTKKREVGFIAEDMWKKVIDELSDWDESITVALHGAGEPILHKDFLKILSYAASKKNLAVGFLSNGSLWTEELAKAILDTDVSWIGFSVDGADPVKYKNYRGADLKRVESSIEYLISSRKNNKPSIFVNMVALPDLDPEAFISRWIDKVDEVKISTYRPVGHRDFLTEKVKRIPCYLLNDMLVITWNGKAVLCCEDIWAENIVGKFPEQSLAEIWHSAAFNKMRRLHNKGKYGDIQICATCDSWSNIYSQTEREESRNLRITRTAAQVCYSKERNASPQA
jgi:radical SAM protein with 4Fe4S-binding SPASM domain